MRWALLLILLCVAFGCRSCSWERTDWVCDLPARDAPSIRAFANKAGVRQILYRESFDTYIETEIEITEQGQVLNLVQQELGISSVFVREMLPEHRVHIQYRTTSENKGADGGRVEQVKAEVNCHEGRLDN